MARVFSQKHSPTIVGNDGIYSVGTKSVYQIRQSGKTEFFTSVSWEGLTRKILARHNCLYPVLTLRILVMCKAHASLCGKLSREILARHSCLHLY